MMLTQLSPAILPILEHIPTLYYAQWYRPICLTGTRILPNSQPCEQHAGLACLRCLPFQTWLPLAAGLQLFQHWSLAFRLIVADSEHLHRELNQWGCRSTKVIHSAVQQCAERPPLQDPPLVAFAGRLVPEKGVHILLEAARQFPETQFLIAGDGPQRLALHSQAGPNVEFTGHIGRAEMEARFARAWVQVVPSLWAEPFGIVAAEAQMRGTAVIASNDGGLKEIIVDRQTGLLITPGDVPALTQALRQLLTNREQAESMGRAARLSAISRFGLEAFANRFLEAYRSIL
jgi:glycosyltransferase involved in cell wall biosynthesis